MATPRGIFELKFFFGSHVATDTGGACSATAIRALIKQLIGAEDGKKPCRIANYPKYWAKQGIVVARRTVAKYRESLNIPPVNLRKTPEEGERMNLQISGHHIEVHTPALREYVENKLDPVVRHFDKVTGVNVVLPLKN